MSSPFRIFLAVLLSASVLLASSSTLHALSPGDTSVEYKFEESDSDGDGVADSYSGQLYICFTSIFYDRVSSDTFNGYKVYETSSSPALLFAGEFDPSGSNEYRLADKCSGGVNVGDNHTYRVCAVNLENTDVDEYCNADFQTSAPAEVPAWPTDTETGSYPSFGFMVGVQILLITSIFIVIAIVRMYSPRSRR